jgi:hypothetical protein
MRGTADRPDSISVSYPQRGKARRARGGAASRHKSNAWGPVRQLTIVMIDG